jgi:hypothetical protein
VRWHFCPPSFHLAARARDATRSRPHWRKRLTGFRVLAADHHSTTNSGSTQQHFELLRPQTAKISSSRCDQATRSVKAARHNRLGGGILPVPAFRAKPQQIWFLSPGETQVKPIAADVNSFFECIIDHSTVKWADRWHSGYSILKVVARANPSRNDKASQTRDFVTEINCLGSSITIATEHNFCHGLSAPRF